MTTKIKNYVFYNDDKILNDIVNDFTKLLSLNKLYKIDFHIVDFGNSENIIEFDHSGKLIYNLKIESTYYHNEIVKFEIINDQFIFTLFKNNNHVIQFSKNKISEIQLIEYETLGQSDLKISIIL